MNPRLPSKLYYGGDYNPEQWPESQWDADLSLMEAAHVHVVRVGEFAWSTMEPTEGQYNFGWLDRAIAAAAKHHICVVLGTPTGVLFIPPHLAQSVAEKSEAIAARDRCFDRVLEHVGRAEQHVHEHRVDRQITATHAVQHCL